jgi:hypothetical protein
VAAGICPQKWFGQLQWQMLVTGQQENTLAVFDPGDGVISDTERMHTLLVRRDDAAIAEIIEKVTAFREFVIKDEPISGDKVTSVAVRWYKAYKQVEQAKAFLEIAQADLLAAAKDAGVSETPLATISESTRQGAVDYPKLLQDLGFGDLHEEKINQFRKPSSSVVSVRKTPGADSFLSEWEQSLIEKGKNNDVTDEDVVKPASALPKIGSMSW